MARKRVKEVIGFDDRLLIILGIPIAGLIITSILFSDKLVSNTLEFFLFCFPISMFYTTIFGLIFRQIISFFMDKYPGQEETLKAYIINITPPSFDTVSCKAHPAHRHRLAVRR